MKQQTGPQLALTTVLTKSSLSAWSVGLPNKLPSTASNLLQTWWPPQLQEVSRKSENSSLTGFLPATWLTDLLRPQTHLQMNGATSSWTLDLETKLRPTHGALKTPLTSLTSPLSLLGLTELGMELKWQRMLWISLVWTLIKLQHSMTLKLLVHSDLCLSKPSMISILNMNVKKSLL